MKKYRIYSIIILFVFLLSMFLPNYYKEIFGQRVQYVAVKYSPVDENFIKMTIYADKDIEYSDINGTKKFTFEEYEEKLPFTYYYDLITNDRFPKKFIMYAHDIKAIKNEKSFFMLEPYYISKKAVNLFPLFESKPKHSGLSYPKDLFKIDDKGMTFIISENVKIDENKSKIYNDILLSLGAIFPLKKAFGNPTLMKAFDEGYFITDAKNNLFHVKMVQNKPVINKIKTNIDIKYILVKEDKRREFYGLVVDTSSYIYLLMYDNYELVKLPIKDYDFQTHSFEIKTTPINRIISTKKIDYKTQKKVIKHYITNLDYELINENEYKYSIKKSKLYEAVKTILFPFELSISHDKTYYASFEIINISKASFLLSLIFSILYILYIRYQNRDVKDYIVQIIFIIFGGIYSIIALILFDKFLLSCKKIISKV